MKEVKENLTIPMVVSGEVHLLPWITQTIVVLTEIMLTILPHNSLFHCVRYGQAFFQNYGKPSTTVACHRIFDKTFRN